MFKLDPITTGNLLTIIQITIIILGFFFSVKSLKNANHSLQIAGESLQTAKKSLETAVNNLAVSANNSKISAENAKLTADNARAQLFNQMILQGRDLQWRRWTLFVDLLPATASDSEKKALAIKQGEFLGIVIAYYASCFELRQVLSLPDSVTKLLDAEVKEIMRHKPFQEKFSELKYLNVFSKTFLDYVDQNTGV